MGHSRASLAVMRDNHISCDKESLHVSPDDDACVACIEAVTESGRRERNDVLSLL